MSGGMPGGGGSRSPNWRSPHPAQVVQRKAPHPATGRSVMLPHPATVPRERAAQPRMATSARPPHPATLAAGSVAQPSGITGGKGGLTYGDALNDRSSDLVDQAMSNLNMTGVKGHGLGGGGSHESSQTVNERKKLVKEVKRLEAKEYKDSRPKAKIHQEASKSPYEKAKKRAAELERSVEDVGERQVQFDTYIETRSKVTGWTPTETQWDTLYGLLGLFS